MPTNDIDERRNDMAVLAADAEEISHMLSDLARHAKRDVASDALAEVLASQCAAAQVLVDTIHSLLREEARK